MERDPRHIDAKQNAMDSTLHALISETSATISSANARAPTKEPALAPLVDLSGFLLPDEPGSEAKRSEAVDAVLLALIPPAPGLFRIAGHGIDKSSIDRARCAFYALEEKEGAGTAAPEDIVGFRGYAPPGSERTGAIYNASSSTDACSCFSVGPPDGGEQFEPNTFPTQDFKEAFESLYFEFDDLDHAVYSLFNAALKRVAPRGEPINEILKVPFGGARRGLLRAKLYKTTEHSSHRAELMAGHADVTPFTVLFADGPGLEIAIRVADSAAAADEASTFEWRPAPKLGPGELYVNTGEVIRAISNDRFRPCVHRVGDTEPAGARMSLAFFSAACYARGAEAPLILPVTEPGEPVKFPPWCPEDFTGHVIAKMRGSRSGESVS